MGVAPAHVNDQRLFCSCSYADVLRATLAASVLQEIASHRVVVFMKGFPEQPMCGFSARVCRVLDYHGTSAKEHKSLFYRPSSCEGVSGFTLAGRQEVEELLWIYSDRDEVVQLCNSQCI